MQTALARDERDQMAGMTSPPPLQEAATAVLRRGQIPGLDGLRALSVLTVIYGHYGFGAWLPGGLGVTVFFFISGFLITTLLLREIHATGKLAIGRFYLRRLLRLQPELWAMLLISSIAGIAYAGWPRTVDIVGALLYVSNYIYNGVIGGDSIGHTRWPHLWSLAVEEHYYLTYPLLVLTCLNRPGRLLILLLGVLVAALMLRIGLNWAGVDSFYLYSATECRLDSIAWGCVTALGLWLLPQAWRDALAEKGWILGILAGAIMLASLAVRDPTFRYTWRFSLQGFSLALGFFYLYAGRGRWVTRLLDVAPLAWMGRMSYGAYLWHLEVSAILDYFTGVPGYQTPSPAAFLAATGLSAASFAVAWASWTLLQRPLLAVRRRLHG